jgi:Carboxypeptidase regulatory-like domain
VLLRNGLLGLALASLLVLCLAASAVAAGSAKIEGTVLNTALVPIAEIEVCAYESGTEFGFPICAKTRANGEYTLSGLAAGKYTVEFSSPSESALNYVTQYYRNKSSFSQAEPVTVAEAETISGINAELEEGGRIAGRAVAASSGAPVEGILVCAFTQSNEELGPGGCATTNANGEYTVSALPPGEYVVGFMSFATRGVEYVTQYFNDKASPTEASLVRVTPKATAGNVDAALIAAGQINGKVTSAATGAALNGAKVCALLASTGTLAVCTVSGTGGVYTLGGLAPGEYKVEFAAGTRYLKQYYNDQYTLAEAQVLNIAAGGLATNINAALELGPLAGPKNLIAPTIAGSGTVGATLACANGTWTGAPAPRFTYAWLRDGAPIAGAGASSYTVQSADEGHTLACAVTATNVVASASATSAGVVVPIASPPPLIPRVTLAAGKVHVSGRSLSVRVTCSGAPCQGSAELTLQIVVKHRHKGRLVTRKTTLILAKGSFSLAAGQTGVVVLHLTTTGRTRLAHAKHHPVTAQLSLSLKGAKATVKRVRVS